MIVLGLDPAFAIMGWAIGGFGPDLCVTRAGLIETVKSDKKLRVRSMDDTFRRSRDLANQLQKLIEQWHPWAIALEGFSPVRNASSTGKIGHAYGVIAAMAELRKLPVVSVSPQELKIELTGKRSASKEEVTAAAKKRFPKVRIDAVPSKANHCWDAVAVLIATQSSDVMLALRR